MFVPFSPGHDYGALEAELNRRADLKTNYWFKRVFRPAAHRDYLGLSWLGDTEYELALTARRKADEAEKQLRLKDGRAQGRAGRRAAGVSEKKVSEVREAASLAARADFKTEKPARYSYSAYVFFKTSEAPPAALSQIDRDLEQVYRAAPLHHYLLFMRRTEQSDADTTTDPGPWAPEKPTFPTAEALVDYLIERVFPEPCPKPLRQEDGGGGLNWPLISGLGAAGIVAAAAGVLWLAFARGEDSLAAASPASPASAGPAAPAVDAPQPVTDGRLAELEGGIEDLRAEFAGLRRDVAALTAGGAAPADFTATARALDSLAERLADASSAPASIAPGGGLDRPPCLPVREVEGRVVPEYLFTAVLSDAGITALPRPSRPDGPDLSPYQARFGALGQTVSAETFRARAAPVLTAQPDCRHYALLVEEAMSSAALYAAQRQAVEDHFYIFRLQP